MELSASAASPFACHFVPRKCKHEQLFLDSYLRTNRTNHTKIMRCFPHCCPGHRKRSYCGSPLFVQFDQHHPTHTTYVATDDLVVFGRFRPLTVSHPRLRIGSHVSLASIEASLQRDDPSTGEWVEAELSHTTTNSHDGTVSSVFEVNASARWYYPWSGAATIALRATEHVFEVLVFRRVDALELQLLADATSSTFRLMSFRRGVAAAGAEAKSDALEPTTSDVVKSRPVTPKARSPPTKKRARTDLSDPIKLHNIKLHKDVLSPNASHAGSVPRAPSPAVAFAPSPPSRTTVPRSAVVAASGDTATTSSLGALTQWLGELPINSAGSRRLADWEQIVMDSCADVLARTRGEVRAPRRQLVSILSALQVSPSLPPLSQQQSQRQPSSASPLDVIDATMRTLLYVLVNPDCSAQLANVVSPSQLEHSLTHESSADVRGQFTAMFATWSQEVDGHAKRFADAQTRASWAQLNATADTLQHQNPRASVGDDCFGYRAFVAHHRERYAQQQRQQAESARATKRRRATGFSISSLMNAKTPVFARDARVWVTRIENVAIDMDPMVPHALSLLVVLQFWRNLSCLRLEYTPQTSSGQAAQLCLASVFNTDLQDECFTRLTLDGRYRWFQCLPTGESTTGTTLMGYIVGDYVGRATSVGTIHVTTFLWPSATTASRPSRAYAWHWTIDAASLAAGSATTLNVIVESAPIHDHDPTASFETMTIAEKLRCVGRWSHTCQLQLRYHAQ